MKSPANVSCFKGLIQSINGLLQLSDDLFQSDLNITYMLTYKINQDPLENFFSQIRGRGGFTRNPSLSEFNNIIGRLLSMKLLSYASNLKNCESDDDEYVQHAVQIDVESSTTLSINNDSEPTTSEAEPHERAVETVDESSITLLEASKRYFSGYVAFKQLKRTPCPDCSNVMIMSENNDAYPCSLKNDSELLIFHKNYFVSSDFGGLIPPSDHYFNLCSLHIDIFAKFFKNHAENNKIKATIVNMCIDESNSNNEFQNWFNLTNDCTVNNNCDNDCAEHRIKTLDFIILVLLRKNCSWRISIKKEKIAKNNQRLQILLN